MAKQGKARKQKATLKTAQGNAQADQNGPTQTEEPGRR